MLISGDFAPAVESSLKFVLAQLEDQNMKRSRFSEEQIIAILKEHEVGLPMAVVSSIFRTFDQATAAP